jgi:hypothetical protein
MEIVHFSETLLSTYKSARRYKPEKSNMAIGCYRETYTVSIFRVFDSQRLSHPVPDRMFEKLVLACPVPDSIFEKV